MAKKKVEAKVPQIGVGKYFQLVNPPIHEYTRAYLSEQYRGIMKSKDGWETEMEKYKTKGE